MDYLDLLEKEEAPEKRHWIISGDVYVFQDVVSYIKSSVFPDSRYVYLSENDNLEYALMHRVDFLEDDVVYVISTDDASRLDFLSLYTPKQQPFGLILCCNDKNSPKHFSQRANICQKVKIRLKTSVDIRLWVTQRLNVASSAAQHLVEYARYNTGWLSSFIKSVELLEIPTPSIEALIFGLKTSEIPGSLEYYLLRGDKRQAFRCIPDKGDARQIFRAIERLNLEGSLLYETNRTYKNSKRLLILQSKLNQSRVEYLLPHLGKFDKAAFERRTTLITKIADRACAGDKTAWLSLVTLW